MPIVPGFIYMITGLILAETAAEMSEGSVPCKKLLKLDYVTE